MTQLEKRAYRVQGMRERGEWPEANETWREFKLRKRKECGEDACGIVAAWLIAIFTGAVIAARIFAG